MVNHPDEKVLIATNARAILIPKMHKAARMFSTQAKELDLNGQRYYAVEYNESNTKALRLCGVGVKPPILSYYGWPTVQPPLVSQRAAAAAFTLHKRMYNTSQMGTGKTRTAAYCIDYLTLRGCVTRTLIVAPLSTINVVWFRELFTNFGGRLSPVVLYGPKEKRLKLLNDPQYNVHIINHDALQIISEEAVTRKLYDMVVVDELSAFRTKNTRRWKHLNLILNGDRKRPHKVPYVLGLTGTPTPNAPTDAWAQCRLITPQTVPKSFVRFRDQTMIQVSQFRWVAKKEAPQIVARAMQPCARFTREDCFDLPPVTFSDREVEMSDEQKGAYSTMAKHLLIEAEEGKITAVNEGVKLGKLLQICGGYVYTDAKVPVGLKPIKRLETLDTLIHEAEGKIIVFATFIPVVDLVYDYLKAQGHKAAKIYGSTPQAERDRIFHGFQQDQEFQVLVAHPRTMSHGLTLTAASTIVWYLPTTSSETYTQANSRISRGGQKQHQHVIHLIGSKIERDVYTRLSKNLSLQGLLLKHLETA